MRFVSLMRCSASIAVLGALAVAGSAHAQDAAPVEDEIRTVDEIVVTAQKREQSLQDVPVVVTALSQQLMQDAGVKDIKDLQVLTPGLTVTSTSNETVTTARIRGVGTVGDNPGLESSVGVVIDGVYRPRNGVSFGDLGEVTRIEVLKGPQGTLFGKNTSAGVINILTAEPKFTFGGTGELTAGNFGQLGASASETRVRMIWLASCFSNVLADRDLPSNDPASAPVTSTVNSPRRMMPTVPVRTSTGPSPPSSFSTASSPAAAEISVRAEKDALNAPVPGRSPSVTITSEACVS